MFMSPKYLFTLLIAIAVTLEVIADILLKKWSMSAQWPLFAIGIFIYFLGTVSWAYSLRYEHLSKAIILFTLANLIVITFAGLIFFDEHLSRVNKIGILLGMLSIVMIEI